MVCHHVSGRRREEKMLMFTKNHSRSFGGKRVASFSCLVTSPQRTILVGIMKFDAAWNLTKHKIWCSVKFRKPPSSETQGRLAGARGNKSDKEMKRRWFTSKAEKAPGNRLLPDHFQMVLPMLPPDWAEKSFVLFCPMGEQQLLRYCGVFLHDDFRIALFA